MVRADQKYISDGGQKREGTKVVISNTPAVEFPVPMMEGRNTVTILPTLVNKTLVLAVVGMGPPHVVA